MAYRDYGDTWVTPEKGGKAVVQAPFRDPDDDDSAIYNIAPERFKGNSYRSLLDDMTLDTQSFLVWVVSQSSPSEPLAHFAAYLNRRRAENEGDNIMCCFGMHKGRTYIKIYDWDKDYIDWCRRQVGAIAGDWMKPCTNQRYIRLLAYTFCHPDGPFPSLHKLTTCQSSICRHDHVFGSLNAITVVLCHLDHPTDCVMQLAGPGGIGGERPYLS